MDKQVKRCPFCGFIPQVASTFYGGPPAKMTVICDNGECLVKPSVIAEDRERVIFKWNQRTAIR